MQSSRPASDWSIAEAESATVPRVLKTRGWTAPSTLRLTLAERRLVLALCDLLILCAALATTLALRAGFVFSWTVLGKQYHYFLLLTLLWGLWAAFFDCYELPRTADGSQSAWSAGRAAFLTALTYLAIPYYTPHLPTSRLSSYLFVALVTVSLPVWRAIYAMVVSQPVFQQRILVVGAGCSGRKMARILAQIPEHGNPYSGSGYLMAGYVDDDPEKAGARIEGSLVLGNRCDLVRLVHDYRIDLLVIAITHPPQIHPELFQALLDCREHGVDVEMLTSFYERLTGRILVEHAGHDLGLVVPMPDSPTQHIFAAGKRIFDLLAAGGGLLALTLIAPCVALANAIWCPGPLFYRQVRIGRGGNPFHLFKFRSMIPAAEKGCGAVWASAGDDRVTPVGRFLRKTRIDELPQLWNVLKGEMSVVGPRPERPEFVQRLVKEVPFYQARHAVRPGITGWAQVRYCYGSCVEDALVKLEYDLYYIRRQSVYLELSILAKTAAVVLGLKGW